MKIISSDQWFIISIFMTLMSFIFSIVFWNENIFRCLSIIATLISFACTIMASYDYINEEHE